MDAVVIVILDHLDESVNFPQSNKKEVGSHNIVLCSTIKIVPLLTRICFHD